MHRATDAGTTTSDPTELRYVRATVDLTSGALTRGAVACRNLEDALGGFGRSFQGLARHTVTDPLAPASPLVVNTGILTGTTVMTGLRTYFSAYSPLKRSPAGRPAAMWSAASGKFGSKLVWSGLDEIVVQGRSAEPVVLVVREADDGPTLTLIPAGHLLGLECYRKILTLYRNYPDGHFAVIGPAGEHYRECAFASVALSTENLLRSGDDKCRWAGRGGMGTVMGSKNLIGIVAEAADRAGTPSADVRALNREIATGPGSRKFREEGRGGLGGTWANYEPLNELAFVPQRNFRPRGDDAPRKMFRRAVEPQFVIKAESCYRCGINCHKNVYERAPDGTCGAFRAKFDYEPLNLLSTNLGIDDPPRSVALGGAGGSPRPGRDLARYYARLRARLQRAASRGPPPEWRPLRRCGSCRRAHRTDRYRSLPGGRTGGPAARAVAR